nr:MAG TPA: hypothetical protein [Caudoviricetes sp.]
MVSSAGMIFIFYVPKLTPLKVHELVTIPLASIVIHIIFVWHRCHH